MALSKENSVAVVAIDFGTTCTGYAFWIRDKERKFIDNIKTKQKWAGATDVGIQAPTTVLMDETETFVSFGFEAEKRYNTLALRNNHNACYYFRHFKMKLHHEENLSTNTLVEDVNGKTMRALTIFTEAIRYIKGHLLEKLKEDTGYDYSIHNVNWVLTVPAIWRESAKQFMRRAATEAGIPNANLSLALEPEAAAIFCKELAVTRCEGVDGSFLRAFNPGETYIIVDMGGGTVDVTAQTISKEDGSIQEVYQATGGEWGGELVNKSFADFIEDLVTEQVFQEYRKSEEKDWIDMQNAFESKKRAFTDTSDADFNMATLIQIYERVTKKKFATRVQNTHTGYIEITKNFLVLKKDLMKSFFDEATGKIISHLEHLLQKEFLKCASTILLVGGFSEQKLVSDGIRKYFEKNHQKRVLVPSSAGSAVLKGAVMYGIDPRVISSRISPYTYGIHTRHIYNENIHPKERKRKAGDIFVVDNVFLKSFEAGQSVYVGESPVERQFIIVNKNIPTVIWRVYQSGNKDVKFCDEKGCTQIGNLEVNIPKQIRAKEFLLKLNMTCEGTELMVKAEIPEHKYNVSARFDFLMETGSDSADEPDIVPENTNG